MLSDAQWALLEPLIEACRPKGKTPPQDLRRTLSAILWRHQNGAKWRSVPDELGPWWRAAQVFVRWARAGVWARLLTLVQERGVQLGTVFLDGTSVRAHQKAAGARRKGDLKLSERIVKRLSAHPGRPNAAPVASLRMARSCPSCAGSLMSDQPMAIAA